MDIPGNMFMDAPHHSNFEELDSLPSERQSFLEIPGIKYPITPQGTHNILGNIDTHCHYSIYLFIYLFDVWCLCFFSIYSIDYVPNLPFQSFLK